MLVNHIQVAYVLQITPLEAKFMLAPHIERIREMVIPGKRVWTDAQGSSGKQMW